jgi:hypothetical protein
MRPRIEDAGRPPPAVAPPLGRIPEHHDIGTRQMPDPQPGSGSGSMGGKEKRT